MISPPPQLPARPDPPVLAAREVETPTHLLFRWYSYILPVLLGAYMFLDRGIAYLHIPGTPAYIGELTLLLGFMGLAVGTNWIRRGFQNDLLLNLIVIWMFWGLCRAVPNIHRYGFTNVVHDSALWYYASFALLMVIVATAIPDLPGRMVRGFDRILPYLIVWELVAFGISKAGIKGPRITGSPLFSHKGGNVCVITALCLAYLWLVPGQRRGTKAQAVLSAIGLLTIALSVTQTRGGSLSALIGIIVALCFMGARQRGRIIISVTIALVLIVTVLGVTNLTIHTRKRNISLADVVGEVESSIGAVNGGNSGLYGQGVGAGTTRWRENLWKNILHAQTSTGHIVTGLGFGPNLAALGGIRQRSSSNSAVVSELRSAHNSHLDVEARMGIIGIVLWVAIWFGWFRRMLQTRRRFRERGDALNKALCEVLMAGLAALLVNAFFDPTFEGAQVAAVAWSAYGLGILLSRGPITVPGMSPPAALATSEPVGAGA